MTHSTAARRIGNKMAEVLIEDFKNSGYIGMFTADRKTFHIKSNGQMLTIRCWADAVTHYTHVNFTVSNVVSGRTETLEHRFTNRSLGWTKVMREITASWELDMLWLVNTLATLLDLLYTNYDINGERKKFELGGKGYSGIAKDSVVSEWDSFRHTGSLAGGGES